MSQWEKIIMITGGAGFIASHVTIHLVKKFPTYRVIVFDKLDYCASINNLDAVKDFPNFKFIQGDICESDFIRYILQEERIDTVLHFAAQTHVDLSYWSSLEFTRNNVYGTHVLINAAYDAGVQRFVHVSTDEVYGGHSTVALHEGDKMNPTNPYAASKAAAECVAMSYWESFKALQIRRTHPSLNRDTGLDLPLIYDDLLPRPSVDGDLQSCDRLLSLLTSADDGRVKRLKASFPVIITRGNNVYGPQQYPEKAIPKFISLLHRDKKCFIHGKGEAMRNFIYVTDVAEAFDAVLHKGKPGEIYNIGTDTEVTVMELARTLIRMMKGITDPKETESWLEYVQDRPFNDPRYPLDSSKLKSLGWEPKVSWEEGLLKTIEWYKDDSHFAHWPNAGDALTDYPSGSNTVRIVSSRLPHHGPNQHK